MTQIKVAQLNNDRLSNALKKYFDTIPKTFNPETNRIMYALLYAIALSDDDVEAAIVISGITDVVINNPTANIAISDNEIAKVSDPDVLIG